MSNKMIGVFKNKSQTNAYFVAIDDYIKSLGEIKKEIKAQVSYGVKRKFLWMWSYEDTADGVLFLTVCLDHKIQNNNFKYVEPAGKNRWNHHVEVRSKQIASSDWLRGLISAGYEFSCKELSKLKSKE